MPKWPGFAQNFVKAILGNADGPIDASNPLIVTPVSGGGGQSTVTADQGAPGATAWPVQPAGNVAAGAPDAGNPVKTGGKYNAVAPVLDDGDRGDDQLDVNSNRKMTLATLIAGEDLAADVQKVEQRYSNNYIATATTTTVKSGAGRLHAITIGETAAGAITVYDNTAGSGTILIVFKASIAEQTFILDIEFATGLTIVTAGASKLSVAYR